MISAFEGGLATLNWHRCDWEGEWLIVCISWLWETWPLVLRDKAVEDGWMVDAKINRDSSFGVACLILSKCNGFNSSEELSLSFSVIVFFLFGCEATSAPSKENSMMTKPSNLQRSCYCYGIGVLMRLFFFHELLPLYRGRDPSLSRSLCWCMYVFAEAAGPCTSGQPTAVSVDAWRNQSSNNEQNQPLTW